MRVFTALDDDSVISFFPDPDATDVIDLRLDREFRRAANSFGESSETVLLFSPRNGFASDCRVRCAKDERGRCRVVFVFRAGGALNDSGDDCLPGPRCANKDFATGDISE